MARIKMKKKNLIILFLILSIILYQAGIWLVIIHMPFGHFVRKIGLYLSIISIIIGIVELLRSFFVKNK